MLACTVACKVSGLFAHTWPILDWWVRAAPRTPHHPWIKLVPCSFHCSPRLSSVNICQTKLKWLRIPVLIARLLFYLAPKGTTIDGTVTLDGGTINPAKHRTRFAYVMQEDTLLVCISVGICAAPRTISMACPGYYAPFHQASKDVSNGNTFFLCKVGFAASLLGVSIIDAAPSEMDAFLASWDHIMKSINPYKVY